MLKKWLDNLLSKDSRGFYLFILMASWSGLTFAFFLMGFFLGTFFPPQKGPPISTKPTPSTLSVPHPSSPPAPLSLGGGTFLLQQDQRFLICRWDDQKELKIIRVYGLKRDDKRFPKDPSQIALHRYYFDDITLSTKENLSKKKNHFIELGRKPLYLLKFSREANDLAEEIADLGGVAFLMGYFTPKSSIRLRKAAALALGARGYKKSLPFLLPLIREKDLTQRKKVLEIISKLTSLKFSPKIEEVKIEEVEEQVQKWLQK